MEENRLGRGGDAQRGKGPRPVLALHSRLASHRCSCPSRPARDQIASLGQRQLSIERVRDSAHFSAHPPPRAAARTHAEQRGPSQEMDGPCRDPIPGDPCPQLPVASGGFSKPMEGSWAGPSPSVAPEASTPAPEPSEEIRSSAHLPYRGTRGLQQQWEGARILAGTGSWVGAAPEHPAWNTEEGGPSHSSNCPVN